MLSSFDISARRAQISPDKLALHEVSSGEKLTYRELDDRAVRFAEALIERGFKKGSRIGILCHNRNAFFEILFGCAKAGIILVPFNWRLTSSELHPLIQDSGAELLIHDDATSILAEQTHQLTDIPLLEIAQAGSPASPGSYQSWLADCTGETRFAEEHAADDIWYLLYTSGTTGIPKAVIQTFGMAWANHINISQATDLTSQDVTPNFLPLFHTAGINLMTLPTLICGGTVKVLEGFDADQFLALIDRGELTALLAVPAIYQALSQHPDFKQVDLTKIRSWSSGGAPLSPQLIRLFADRGALICQGYGMTETGPTVFLMDPEHVLEKTGSVGKPQIMSQVRIADTEGADVAPGDSGEILFKGANITPGYWNRPDATSQTIDADGWLHSGDVGRMDDDGYFYIVDRIKDMYISGGENVYPAEVERVLIKHPAILEAAVIGVPDKKWGEVGKACLLLTPGAQPSEEEIFAHCRSQLAGYKVPKSIQMMTELPRTPAGKVQKHLLSKEPA